MNGVTTLLVRAEKCSLFFYNIKRAHLCSLVFDYLFVLAIEKLRCGCKTANFTALKYRSKLEKEMKPAE